MQSDFLLLKLKTSCSDCSAGDHFLVQLQVEVVMLSKFFLCTFLFLSFQKAYLLVEVSSLCVLGQILGGSGGLGDSPKLKKDKET